MYQKKRESMQRHCICLCAPHWLCNIFALCFSYAYVLARSAPVVKRRFLASMPCGFARMSGDELRLAKQWQSQRKAVSEMRSGASTRAGTSSSAITRIHADTRPLISMHACAHARTPAGHYVNYFSCMDVRKHTRIAFVAQWHPRRLERSAFVRPSI